MSDLEGILQKIIDIDPNNAFIQYIVKRIRRDDYRGWHISQHNRYNKDIVYQILKIVYEVAGDREFAIPPGDWPKNLRGKDETHYTWREDELKYNRIIINVREQVKTITGRARQNQFNALKKNLFVDFDRLGFLKRIERSGKYYATLTDSGKAFINTKDVMASYKYFTDALDNLFHGKLGELVTTISLSDYRDDEITTSEFMFIVSDLYMTGENKISKLKSYRSLSADAQRRLKRYIEQYAQPENFSGDKKNKRDFHNWKNQAEQIISLLQQTVYFARGSAGGFGLNTGRDSGLFYGRRRSAPKNEYFQQHEVIKRRGFELHHIVPFNKARNNEEAKLIDNYRNFIYLSYQKHQEFKGKNKEHVVLELDSNEVAFSHIDTDLDSQITAQNNQNAYYSKETSEIQNMKSHNTKLVNRIYR